MISRQFIKYKRMILAVEIQTTSIQNVIYIFLIKTFQNLAG